MKCEGEEVAVTTENCILTYIIFPHLILQNVLQKILYTGQKQVKKET